MFFSQCDNRQMEVFCKKNIFLKISINSQENTCVRSPTSESVITSFEKLAKLCVYSDENISLSCPQSDLSIQFFDYLLGNFYWKTRYPTKMRAMNR